MSISRAASQLDHFPAEWHGQNILPFPCTEGIYWEKKSLGSKLVAVCLTLTLFSRKLVQGEEKRASRLAEEVVPPLQTHILLDSSTGEELRSNSSFSPAFSLSLHFPKYGLVWISLSLTSSLLFPFIGSPTSQCLARDTHSSSEEPHRKPLKPSSCRPRSSRMSRRRRGPLSRTRFVSLAGYVWTRTRLTLQTFGMKNVRPTNLDPRT